MTALETRDGLICACLLDGRGRARPADWAAVRAWRPEQGVLWVHLERNHPEAQRWVLEHSGVEPAVAESLLAEESRPRLAVVGEALTVNLRGVNLNPGADPEDMVSLRMWLEPRRIITLRQRHLMSIQDLREALAAGRGPRDAGDFLARTAEQLIERMTPVIDDLGEAVDDLENALVDEAGGNVRGPLAEQRRRAITLRRYLAPQREVLARLQTEAVPWLAARQRAELRETAEHVTRMVEDLNAVRDRAAVIQDEHAGQVAAQMNRSIYLLTVVAAIILPLSLVTGLLGINVGGIPGSDSPWGFAAVVAVLAALAAGVVGLLRWLRIF